MSVPAVAAVVGGESCSSLYRLLVGGQGRWEFAPVAHLLKDRQAARGSVAPLGANASPLGAALLADSRVLVPASLLHPVVASPPPEVLQAMSVTSREPDART